jgi:hypothetical protein
LGDFSISVGEALPYVVEQFLGLMGADAHTKQTIREIRLQQQIAIKDCSSIQMPGMPDPIPFPEIYQPVKLVKSLLKYEPTDVLEAGTHAVISGGPGQGKTTVLHSMFRTALKSMSTIPFLFTLRRANSVESLHFVVSALEESGKAIKKLKPHKFTLFVDGYDELSEENRKRVSEYLARYDALNCGNYVISCRSYYDVYNLKLSRYTVAPFDTNTNVLPFINNFSGLFKASLDARRLVDELDKRGFASFYEHPLLLTLVCLLKVHMPNVDLPANTVSLLTDAVNMLAFRWDLSMGTSRESLAKVGGHDRLNCLMRIACAQRQPTYREEQSIGITTEHLRLMHREDVDPRQLLIEIARFYGLFIPIEGGWWEFVHRTIQDYLAARFTVESGKFGQGGYTHFDFRDAYAACLNPDSATEFMIRALDSANNMVAIHECIHNHAAYDAAAIAGPLVNRYLRQRSYCSVVRNADWLRIDTNDDWILSAPIELLIGCMERSIETAGETTTGLIAACLLEIESRNQAWIRTSLLQQCMERLSGCNIVQVNVAGVVKTALTERLNLLRTTP